MTKPLLLVALAACGTTPTPTPVTPPAPPAPPASRDISPAWLQAIEARDAKAIEGILGLPFTFYYDDNWTGRRPAECDPVRVVREVTTAAERTAVATCIAATVQVTTVSTASGPIGIWDPARLIPELPEIVHAKVNALAADHVFVHGPSLIAGDYDFTLAVPKDGDPRARLLVLWTING